jgi:hypothetical protein
VADDHRLGESLVQLTELPSRFEADAIAAMLEAHGIRATVYGNDADGWAPQFQMLHGNRIVVFEGDLERALQLLDAPPAPPPA